MKVILMVLVAFLATAQGRTNWSFEQVDGDSVNISRVDARIGSDGVIHVCYGPSNSRFYHAWRDSVWHRELAVTDSTSSLASMAVGRHGEVGILLSKTGLAQLVEKHESLWSIDTLPHGVGGYYLAYDTAGDPCFAYDIEVPTHDYGPAFAERHGTTWDSTIITYYQTDYFRYYGLRELVFDTLNRPYTCNAFAWTYHSYVMTLEYLCRNDSGKWFGREWYQGGENAGIYAFDAGDTGEIAGCLCIGDSSYYNSGMLEPQTLSWARVRLDSAARPHLIMPWGNVVEHRYKYDGRWYRDTVMLQSEGSVANLCYCPHGDFLVLAFIRNGAPWIAWRGVPHVALAERPSDAAAAGSIPTLVRGVLFLPLALGVERDASSVLLDISGRKVMDLKPGANDVRAVAPGVYFVREQPQASSHQPQAVRKVVVTK